MTFTTPGRVVESSAESTLWNRPCEQEIALLKKIKSTGGFTEKSQHEQCKASDHF